MRVSTTVGTLPEFASPAVGEHFTAFILELATNVIRYSTPGTASTLEIVARRTVPRSVELSYTSINVADAPLTQVPRSLNTRAEAVGGRVLVSADPQGRVVVTVTHPLELVDSEVGVEAVPVKDDFRDQNARSAALTSGADSAGIGHSGAVGATSGHDRSLSIATRNGTGRSVGSPEDEELTLHRGHSHRRLEDRRA